MCFSFESSVRAYLLASTFVVLLWLRNKGMDKWKAILLGLFSLVQLLEAGLWKNINNIKINSMLTSLLLMVQWIYPFVNTYFGWKQSKFQYSMEVLTYLVGAGLLYTSYRVITAKEGQIHSDIVSEGNIDWFDDRSQSFVMGDYDWLSIIWMLGVFAPLLFIKNGLTYISLLGTLFWYSKFYYPDSFQSVWCYFSIYLGPVFYAIV